MTIQVLLFAALHAAAGTRTMRVEVPAGATVADLRVAVGDACPPLKPLLDNAAIAINEAYAAATAELHDGDTAAIIPPVSGGA